MLAGSSQTGAQPPLPHSQQHREPSSLERESLELQLPDRQPPMAGSTIMHVLGPMSCEGACPATQQRRCPMMQTGGDLGGRPVSPPSNTSAHGHRMSMQVDSLAARFPCEGSNSLSAAPARASPAQGTQGSTTSCLHRHATGHTGITFQGTILCIIASRRVLSLWHRVMCPGAVAGSEDGGRPDEALRELPEGNPQPYILWQADEACRHASNAAAEEFIARMAEVLDKRSESLTRTNISTMFHRSAKVLNATIQARTPCPHFPHACIGCPSLLQQVWQCPGP